MKLTIRSKGNGVTVGGVLTGLIRVPRMAGDARRWRDDLILHRRHPFRFSPLLSCFVGPSYPDLRETWTAIVRGTDRICTAVLARPVSCNPEVKAGTRNALSIRTTAEASPFEKPLLFSMKPLFCKLHRFYVLTLASRHSTAIVRALEARYHAG